MIELNKVVLKIVPTRCLLTLHFQKFCAHILESEKSVDFMTYLLCFCMDIKDKPGELFFSASSSSISDEN